MPFGVGIMRSETTENYSWLAQSFYKCYGRLPATVIVDGDRKLREAILGAAQHHNLDVAILLCAWHLHCDLEKNLVKKTPNVDVFALKKAFYELRACITEQLFESNWNEFRTSFGTNPKGSQVH